MPTTRRTVVARTTSRRARQAPGPYSSRLACGPGQLVVVVPAAEIVGRDAVRQRRPSVSLCRCPIEREINGSSDREAYELGASTVLRWGDSLEVPCALVVEFDEDLFHIDKYMLCHRAALGHEHARA